MKSQRIDQYADIILTGGQILTINNTFDIKEAIAIRGNRILAVGTADEIQAFAVPTTQVIPLEGRTVIPGVIDAHAHMEREGLKQARLSLVGANNIADILDRIAAEVQRCPKGEWIVTLPVGEPPYYFGGPSTLAEHRMPTRYELDRVAPEHPVCISGVFGNWGEPPGYTALNSLGLSLNNISSNTIPLCESVEIERDESGVPTGIIIEHNYRPTVEFDLLKEVPRFTYSERLHGIRKSMQFCNSVGKTSVYEGHGSSPESISLYRQLWEQGELTVRTSLIVSPTWENIQEAKIAMRDWLAYARGKGFGDPWFRIAGVFIGLGGDPTVATLTRASLPNTGWTGFVEWANTLSDYRELVHLAAAYQLRVHTVVADSLKEVLPIFEEIHSQYGLRGRRWVIEHLGHCTVEQALRLKELGIYVTTLPGYTLWKNGGWYLREPNHGEAISPHRLLLETGIPVACGTDNVPYNPFFTLWVLMTRQERKTGQIIGPNQRLSLQEGLQLLTRKGAYFSFEENQKGTLEAGKLADLAVLSGRLLDSKSHELPSINSVLTLVDGKVVYQHESVDFEAHANPVGR